MTRLDEQYSRQGFESSSDSASLAKSLSDLLTERLRSARDVRAEGDAIVRDLKVLGHELFSWDEADDSQTWGDDYIRPKHQRILVELRFPADEAPSASVTFGPWPSPPPAPLCLHCQKPMTPTHLRVYGVGHGHAMSREVSVEVFLGEQERRVLTTGQRSIGLQVPGFWCSSCAALWLPDTTRIGWTG
jgi:hypothetical protein